MNEFEFDRLLDLYQKGLLTGKQKEMLEAWLHQIDTGSGTPLSEADLTRVKLSIKKKIKGPVSIQWRVARIAASVLILVAVGASWMFYSKPTSKEDLITFSSTGPVSKIALPDGTLVWLKGNSSLQSPPAFSGDTRNVILQGEALFEVAKDPDHPFVIESGKIITTVLGTSFNLKSAADQVELTVLTGKVSLRSCDEANGIIVSPNERVVYSSGKLLVSRKSVAAEEKATTVDGTDYSMKFDDAPLGVIFDRIETKFDVTISLSDEALRNCVIRADFSDQSLKETMDMICQALGFQYSIKEKEVLLRGIGCL